MERWEAKADFASRRIDPLMACTPPDRFLNGHCLTEIGRKVQTAR
jgi:hypothetical protein